MVSGEQGRGPGVGKAPSQRCMSDLVRHREGHDWPRTSYWGLGRGHRGEELGRRMVGSERSGEGAGAFLKETQLTGTKLGVAGGWGGPGGC